MSVIIVVDTHILLTSNQRPPEIVDFITHEIWLDILGNYRQAKSDALALACLGEWCICLCFGFPCIFFCHPCVESAVLENKEREKMNLMNARYFFSQPVISVNSIHQILIHTEFLANIPYVRTTSAQAYMAPQIPIAEVHQYPQSVTPIATVMTAPQRTMQVTIPQGTRGGDMITVMSPDGIKISVQVPAASQAGQVIIVGY